MAIPPAIVAGARHGWKLQWNLLMSGLAPADKNGNYLRPPSKHKKANLMSQASLIKRSKKQLPHLIIGRSCPWAHRTWIIHELRDLKESINLITAKADHKTGRWKLEPKWLGCDSLLALYLKCDSTPNLRATVPALIDPGHTDGVKPSLLGNESAQLVEVLNEWPTPKDAPNLAPRHLLGEINSWQNLLQPAVNEGVYKCGFARTQTAYELASKELFNALDTIEKSLAKRGPLLCGDQLTIADIRLFPTLIRWEMVYAPLFGCTKKPLWSFPSIWKWRQKLLKITSISKTCNGSAWRKDYFGALFPLRPSGIVPEGPDLEMIVKAAAPISPWI